jgi:hypothetical protein
MALDYHPNLPEVPGEGELQKLICGEGRRKE